MTTEETKKFHVANLIKLAKADNKLTQEEVIFVKSVAIKLGISSTDFNEIVLNVESVKQEVPATTQSRVNAFYDFLTMMSLDMNADEVEMNMCVHLGEILGFSDEQIKNAIDLSVKNVDKVVSKAEIEAVLQ